MSLKQYHAKRSFGQTPEPRGRTHKSGGNGRLYVIHKHAASQLHYDLRLEHNGVLLSWAVPKGPSLDPADKRLAVRVEDHPVEYGGFEGTIPEGEYGGGTVLLWDRGEWEPDGDPDDEIAAGKLAFTLKGEKLQGGWVLIRIRGHNGHKGDNWLLIKQRDEHARPRRQYDVLEARPESVASGRSIEKISGKPGADGRKAGTNGHRSKQPAQPKPRRASAKVKSAGKSAFPDLIVPEMATLVDVVPKGADWLHEIKYDGYRLIAMLQDGRAKLITRNGKDWSRKFPSVREAVERLSAANAILDGEVVVLRPDGTQDFQALQNVMNGAHDSDLGYYVFDLLHHNGVDLRATPLRERKKSLQRLLETDDNGRVLRYSDHIEGQGAAVFDQACHQGLEGIVSKQADAPYEERRSHRWVKTKCHARQEFVVGGFTEPAGSRVGLGALLLGYYQDDRLIYAGRVGTGFDQRVLQNLRKEMNKLEQASSPFDKPPTSRTAHGVHWVGPRCVVEVTFAGWTAEGLLRQPSFQGMRKDKPPREVVREHPQPTPNSGKAQSMRKAPTAAVPRSGKTTSTLQVAGVDITHPDKILFAEQGLTKQDLANYYEQIADWILPHATGRPLSIVRCPQGQGSTCFFQKHATESLPEAIHSVNIQEKHAHSKYLVIDDLQGLISLVQLGALEIHPWGSRADAPDQPDRIVFDLDPGPDVAWSVVIDGARTLHGYLDELGLRSFLKTSGGKGLHIVLPIAGGTTWNEAKDFAEALADRVVEADPRHFIATMSKSERRGKVFIDYLRNARGATSVAAYSTRARRGATVSTPLRWDELSNRLKPSAYDVTNIPSRLSSLKRDPWPDFFSIEQSLPRL